MTDIFTITYIINFVCQDHFSKNGYTYPVSPNIPSAVLQNKDCEKAWYRKAPGDGSELEYLSDGQLHVNQSRHPLVVDVSEKNITIKECIELRHNVTCHGSNEKLRHLYQVTDHNSNSPNANSANAPLTTIWIIISIIISITIIIITGIIFWRRLRGCCKQTEEQNDNPNRDHDVSADQNGDAVRMPIQDQTSESDEGPRLRSNQNNGDCVMVNMNDFENDGMKKCR
ncbi:uncharacterized protein LOC125145275 [Tachysurus fulvidraco]|uniref:uncharacterized protein LOC125145275 n=1 Tax=Tachysurus fulvidraco TaxID=1234273 RepID=UPI001FEFB0AA|nr:uncharacterized protein LOC125145275 [Tachysurus fulvidraco]